MTDKKELNENELEKINGGISDDAFGNYTISSCDYEYLNNNSFYTNSNVISSSSEIVCVFSGMVAYYYKMEVGTCAGNYLSLHRQFNYFCEWTKVNDLNEFKQKYPYQIIFDNNARIFC